MSKFRVGDGGSRNLTINWLASDYIKITLIIKIISHSYIYLFPILHMLGLFSFFFLKIFLKKKIVTKKSEKKNSEKKYLNGVKSNKLKLYLQNQFSMVKTYLKR